MVDIGIDNWIYIYSQNKKEAALRGDVYNVTASLSGIADVLDGRINSADSSIAEIETEIENIPTIEDNISEIQDVVAKMIFELNEIGIEFELNKINNFRDKYLNI